jgi:hypothetical protein
MHATQTDHNITPHKIWKKEKNDTNSLTHPQNSSERKTQWRVRTELELNEHSRLNLANEKPLEKEKRKIKTINKEESEEETNCWLQQQRRQRRNNQEPPASKQVFCLSQHHNAHSDEGEQERRTTKDRRRRRGTTTQRTNGGP